MPRILIADDHASFRAACTRVLSSHGYKVDPAGDGDEAIRLLGRFLYDLVLLDLAMPLVDGTTVLRAIRADPEQANIPVIVMTALAEADAGRRVERLDVRVLLVKSRFSVKELLRHVREALAGAVAA